MNTQIKKLYDQRDVLEFRMKVLAYTFLGLSLVFSSHTLSFVTKNIVAEYGGDKRDLERRLENTKVVEALNSRLKGLAGETSFVEWIRQNLSAMDEEFVSKLSKAIAQLVNSDEYSEMYTDDRTEDYRVVRVRLHELGRSGLTDEQKRLLSNRVESLVRLFARDEKIRDEWRAIREALPSRSSRVEP